ncbi:indolepyruvate ferredoxin oxidoreductase family protein [Yunchengibacter salinarum]|uniref:indolepyruvate ferredoxin oxidoreductase family protein n=1 Tax=Yunchengibacter salinarum TaxID=3133399 RepID=UPI0035B5AFF3
MTDRRDGTGLLDYRLEDRFNLDRKRVFLTGTQALARLPLMQRAADKARGLNTAGFISGYRGSPLGGYDQQLWRAGRLLDDYDITFQPAINEDLAATAILGTQQVETAPNREVQGVFSIWYGKGPGVDRSGDALKHGNAYGSSPHGGVLVVAGDDHGCVSSSMSHQSDVAFMAWFMPVLNPANVQEYLEFGLYGFALSRFSGTWVGFKAISETVESGMTVDVPDLPAFTTPDDFTPPPDGLHYRWPDLPGPQIEARLVHKVEAVRAFARANPIDRTVYGLDEARFGIVTTGKGHLDLMAALTYLGLDAARCRELGIDIYKVGMVWPLETAGMLRFLEGKQEVVVVEEKRGIIESQIKEFLYDLPGDKPGRVIGKYDEAGEPLIPWTGELSPSLLAPLIARRLERLLGEGSFRELLEKLDADLHPEAEIGGVKRLPYFCSGCPHNTSTHVPEGSHALAGIGCHFMASWMNWDTDSLIQMGGEGVNWLGKSTFTGKGHVFQNLGEGTYFHSGSMAIRQAIAAGTNITYKILFNDAVAMTGGQPVDGQITVDGIANQVRAEGVDRIAVLSDEPEKYNNGFHFPRGVTIHHRDELDDVQRELRDIPGVTVLIYDQACAAEKRRRRKRGTYPDPAKRVFINDLVCEGCGDCSVQSNCLSVVPKETPFGRKRQIDQSSCNKDYSCLKGFCPSFVTVEGGALKKGSDQSAIERLSARFDDLPVPDVPGVSRLYDMLVAGVGGTGVVTVGQVITMAAHLEGKGASVLDFMGFAQKGGAVLTYVRVGESPDALTQVRTDTGQADAVIACDLVVASEQKALNVMRPGRTKLVVNGTEIPTADYVQDRDADMHKDLRLEKLKRATGAEGMNVIAANRLAEALMGDTVFANMMMMGYATQAGLLPVGLESLDRAIELNGVAVDRNRTAFALGRLAFVDPEAVYEAAFGAPETVSDAEDLDAMVNRRADFLTDYQDRDYAETYRVLVEQVRSREAALGFHDRKLTQAVARYYFKLMAYKDEYEVARLHLSDHFRKAIADTFTGDYTIRHHMAPPLLSRAKDAQGRPKKRAFGPWVRLLFRPLAAMRRLRGTKLDLFGYTQERRMERALIRRYEAVVAAILENLTAGNRDAAVDLASFPDQIRGFGPVKEESVARTLPEMEEKLAAFKNPDPAPARAAE